MIIITLLIIIQSLFVRSNEQNDIFWIGSSPILRIQSSGICDESRGVEKIVSLENQQQNSFFVYCRYCGLSAITIEKNKLLSIINYGKDIQIQQMVLQPGTSNLWIADKLYIYLYDVSQLKHINQLGQIKKENNAGVTIKINFSQNYRRLIIVNKSIVHIYDLTNLNSLKYISAIKGEWETYDAIISEQLNLIFLADGEFKILGIKNKDEANKPSKPIQYEVLCRFKFYYSEFNQLINNQYVISKGTIYQLIGMNLSKFIISNKCQDLVPYTIYQLRGGLIKQIMTQDKKFIINIVSFLAIQILELNYGEQITSKLFQEIEIKAYLMYLSLSFDQQNIIISSEKSIDIYQRNEPNSKKINPSLLNLPQNIAYENFTKPEELGWNCLYAMNSKLLFYAKGDEGLYVFKENESKFLEKQYHFTFNYFGYLEYVDLFNNDTNLVIGRDNFLFFYNIEDIKNPKLLSKTDFQNNNTSLDSGYITRDQQYIILSADTEGVLIADISNITNPFQVSIIYHDYPESTPCTSISVSSDENYVFASYRNQGLVIYDVKDKKKPKIISYLYTFGGESTTIMKNKDYILMADRQNGLNIVDVSDLTKPMIISNTRIDGYMRVAILIQNDEFALCVTRNRGQLVLIDIRDMNNPVLLQKFEYKNFIGGMDICSNQSQDIAYLALENAIVRLKLYPDWSFNTDIYIIMEGNKAKNVYVDKSHVFQLGMNIKIKILQVYRNKNITIDGVKFYHQFKIQLLPQWAFYSESEQSLTLRLDKYALINSNDYSDDDVNDFTNKVIIQQFIFEIKDKLNKYDFISEHFKINKTLSEAIFLDCLNQNLVNEEYLVSQQSQDIIYTLFKKYTNEIIQFIISVLKSKILYYPIAVKIQSSLKAYFDEDQRPYIESISNKIYIQVSIDRKQGQFIETTYQGLLVYFNDKSDQLKVEGEKSQINLFLEKGIKIANFCEPSEIELTMTINDEINFPLIKKFYANHKYLVYLNKPIEINKEKSLQDDFNRKFSKSIIYILESFTYTFSSDIFIDQDNSNIIYEAKIYLDGEYKPIPESYWLSFQSKERQFFGITTAEMYLDQIKIMVNATDGFTCIQDYYVMKVNGIPIRVILITITQILGPIIGLIGLWKYKQILYNNVYQKHYQTTSIKVYSGQEINLQIPLLEKQLKIAQNIWFKYFKDQDKFSILTEMNYIKMTHQNYTRTNGQIVNPQDSNDSQLSLYTSTELKIVKENQISAQFPNDQQRKSQEEQKKALNDVQKSIFFEDSKKEIIEEQKIKILFDEQKQNLADDIRNQSNDQRNQNKKLTNEHKIPQTKNLKRAQINEQTSLNQHNLQIKSIENFRKSSDEQKESYTADLKKQELEDQQIQQENQRRITKFKNKIVKSLANKIIGIENKVKKSFSKQKQPLQDQVNSFKAKYFLQSGRINRQFIISDVLEYYQKKTKSKDDFILDSLLNPKSKLSNIICGLAAISFSKIEKSTFQAVQYLKKIAQQHGYMQTDWYKYYVIIKTQFDKVFVDQFPSLIFENDKLIQELAVLYKSILHQNKEMKLILPFIKEVISAYAYGFTHEKGGYVPSIRGESLEAKSHQIQSIRAYRPLRKKRFCLSKNPSETLIEKELSMNQIIPSWIQSIDISNEVILIKGKTENKDVGEHILKIFDKNNFILKQIRIIIFPKKDENLVTFYMEEDKIYSFDEDDRDSVSMNETPVDASCFPNSLQFINNYSTQCKTIQQIDKQTSQHFIQQTNN